MTDRNLRYRERSRRPRVRPKPSIARRRRRETYRRNDQEPFAAIAQRGRELADRRRLPAAVNADDENHRRLAIERKRRVGQREKILNVALEARDDLIARFIAILFCNDFQRVDDLFGRRKPKSAPIRISSKSSQNASSSGRLASAIVSRPASESRDRVTLALILSNQLTVRSRSLPAEPPPPQTAPRMRTRPIQGAAFVDPAASASTAYTNAKISATTV